MKFSKYNLIFEEEESKFLFNTFSGAFFEIEDELFNIINDRNIDGLIMSKWYNELKENFIIVESDEDVLATLRLENLLKRTDNSLLNLTIAPSMSCNFRCGYCYEDLPLKSEMNQLTESNIIKFISNYNQISRIHVQWYGGEPLLKFNRLKSLTKKIQKYCKVADIKYSADITTNGYLLTQIIVDQLNSLSITEAQITLDGTKKTHDNRRSLIDGGNTFEIIYSNIKYLIDKIPDFKLQIRVNIDKTNKKEFSVIYNKIKTDFPKNSNITVYPGIVQNMDSCNVGSSCLLNTSEQVTFRIDQFRKNGINLGYFPFEKDNVCLAQHINSYVIDSEGYLSKCWLDIGNKNKAIGNVNSQGIDKKLLTRYLAGCDSYSDSKCLECNVFPVCGGGCCYNRIENHFNGKSHYVCSPYKSFIKDYLNIYKEVLTKK